ncbi:MAG: dephospho-CoA kinase, partial [Sediminibacterium sp.]|nr:dephospho-CoA kinase [Sediminibacterium sp.]
TIKAADAWAKRCAEQGSAYIVKEAALLFEAGTNVGLDFIIGVTAPEDMCIARVMARDNITRDEVLKRMQHQLDDNIKMQRCTIVIDNNEKALLIPQVLALHQQFIS